jgi:histidinol-phosphatase
VVAVVSAPALTRRWWATRRGGAFVRDSLAEGPRRIRVSGVKMLEDAQVSYGGVGEWRKIGRLETLLKLTARCWRSRAFGDVWSYMLVAEGSADIGGLDPRVSLWDLAAPLLIVEEAGGRFTDFHGVNRADGGSGVATNGLLHDATLAIVGW